jgi:DNA-binding phage protein
MTKKYQTFRDYIVEKLKDPEEAQSFLNTAIDAYGEDGFTPAFMLSLRYLVEAQGGVNKLAGITHLNKQNLYKVLTGKTAPKLATTFAIIKGLGYTFKAEPINNQ